jgi:segregation and condensation protein B
MSRMRQKRKARGEAERAEAAELEGDTLEGASAFAPESGSEAESETESGSDPDPDPGSDPDSDQEPEHDLAPDHEPEHELEAADAELQPSWRIPPERLKIIIESLLFAAEKPLTPGQLRSLTGVRDMPAIQAALDALVEDHRERGMVLHDVAGGYQFRTHPVSAEYVQRLIAGRPVRLSRAQLETLAIIAYRQPVTRPEIDEIRGVDCGGTLKVLLDRSLIRVLGKKEEPGRPLLYGTSKEFLEFFNLRDLRDLPTLREFHELSEESLREVEALDREGDQPAEAEAPADAPSMADDDLADDASAA